VALANVNARDLKSRGRKICLGARVGGNGAVGCEARGLQHDSCRGAIGCRAAVAATLPRDSLTLLCKEPLCAPSLDHIESGPPPLDSGEVQATKRPLQVQHAAAHLLGSTGARKISDNNRHLPIVLAHTVTACV
jgi:hypothetical protein